MPNDPFAASADKAISRVYARLLAHGSITLEEWRAIWLDAYVTEKHVEMWENEQHA